MHEPRSGRPAAVGATILTVVLLAGCSGSGAGSPAAVTPSAAPASTTAPGASPSVVASEAPSAAASGAPSDGQTAGQQRQDASGIDQVWVPAGTFTMGTDAKVIAALNAESPPDWVASEFPSEQPAHEVTLSKGYWIDRDEVTNQAFAAFVDAGGYTNQSLWSPEG